MTPEQIDEQRAVIGQARSDVGVLLTSLESLHSVRAAYDRLRLSDDAILDDASLIPLGTTRNDLRNAIVAIDALAIVLAQGHRDRLERFARGG